MHVLKRLALLALFVPLFAQAQVDAARRDPMRHFFMPSLGDLAGTGDVVDDREVFPG